MSAQIIAGYAEGSFYPPNLENIARAVSDAGWTTVMLGLFHPNQNGDVSFNNITVFTGGQYVGDPEWLKGLRDLKSPSFGSGIDIIMSIGGGGVGDFNNIKTIFEQNGNTFSGTNLEGNLRELASVMNGVVSAIDMDVEDQYDLPSFVAFCNLVLSLGLKVTFCPYSNSSFWTSALQQVDESYPGGVIRFNLQCYSGGYGNDPTEWAQAIVQQIPTFDPAGFILVSATADQSPAEIQDFLTKYQDNTYVDGAFMWTIDSIISGSAGTMTQYVQAIENGLNED